MLAQLLFFLSLEVSLSPNLYNLTQAKYISNLLSQVDIIDSETSNAPLEPNVQPNTHDGESFRNETLYKQLVGSLVYLTVIRPHISDAVHIANRFMETPHFVLVVYTLHYLKDILFHVLHFSSQSPHSQCLSDAN